MSTELATQDSTELAVSDPETDALAANALAGLAEEDLVLPILKVTQQLSGEVTREEAKSGEFVNSLTGENHGKEVGLIICGYFQGRFYAPKNEDDTYVAQGEVAPDNWPEEFAGRRFDEIEVAEEMTREAANAEGGQWVAPLIQTTHNYIGLVVDAMDLPVRLSLKSTSTPAHRKIATLLRFSKGGRPWSNVMDLKTIQKVNKKDQPYYVVEATRGRETTNEEAQLAVNLAGDYQAAQSVKLVGEVDEAKEARGAVAQTDGLDVA